MKKNSLPPQAIKGIFRANSTRANNYDLNPETGSNLPFNYFRLSKPHEPFMIQQGALFVAESHKDNKKVLFTGLRASTSNNNIMFGDMYEPSTRTKSLLVFVYFHEINSYTVYLYENYYPKQVNVFIRKEF